MRLISRLFVLFLILKILEIPWVFAQDSYPAQQAECVSNTEVSFVCGLINPEDLYQIPGSTDHDITIFKKYEKYFTVDPPGRTFDEPVSLLDDVVWWCSTQRS